jgi:hypothetical protein
MRPYSIGPILSLCFVLIAGCATMIDAKDAVFTRAKFDLACDELQLTELPGHAYGIEGCGMRAVYVFASPDCVVPTQHGRKEFEHSCTPTLDYIGHPHGDGGHDKPEKLDKPETLDKPEKIEKHDKFQKRLEHHADEVEATDAQSNEDAAETTDGDAPAGEADPPAR